MKDYTNIFGELEAKINRLSETTTSAVHNLVLSVDALTNATMKTMKQVEELEKNVECVVKGLKITYSRHTEDEKKIRAKFEGYPLWELTREYTTQYENYIDGTGYYNLYEMDVLEKMMKEAIEDGE